MSGRSHPSCSLQAIRLISLSAKRVINQLIRTRNEHQFIEMMESRCLLTASLSTAVAPVATAPGYSGVVFYDSNGDGVRKSTEYGMTGIKVEAKGVAVADIPNLGIHLNIPITRSVVTGANGLFEFPSRLEIQLPLPINPFSPKVSVPVFYNQFTEIVPSGYRPTTAATIPSTQSLLGMVRVPSITSFELVYAGNGQVLTTVAEGQTLNLAKLPGQLNMFARTTSGQLGSVRYTLDNTYSRVEQAAPWSLFGDIGGKFTPGTFKEGSHTLTVAMYSNTTGGGVLLGTKTLHFNTVLNVLPAIEWSMPKRYGISNNNAVDKLKLIDLPNSYEYVNPSSYTVNLDASKSLSDIPIARYDWVVRGGSLNDAIRVQGKSLNIQVPSLGKYYVTLTVTLPNGLFQSTTQQIKVRDVLIVQLGDSYGSGEGNPEVASADKNKVQWADGVSAYMTYENRQAHRSTKAASSQAAILLEDSDPHFSVTYVNLAQSGAMISHLLGQTYYGIYPVKVLFSYLKLPLMNQLEELKLIAGKRTVDVMSLSIGGNDAGFADRITDMISHIPKGQPFSLRVHADDIFGTTAYYNLHVPLDLTKSLEDMKKGFAKQINLLPNLYDKLHTAIDNLNIPISKTLVTEYADPTHNEKGEYVTTATDFANGFKLQASTTIKVPNPLFPLVNIDIPVNVSTTLPLEIDATEAQVLHDDFMIPLNKKLAEAAGKFGWNYVSGIADSFKTHGYAAQPINGKEQRWFVTEAQSRIQQGIDDTPINQLFNYDVGFTIKFGVKVFGKEYSIEKRVDLLNISGGAYAEISKGGMHPNFFGHESIAKRILPFLLADVT